MHSRKLPSGSWQVIAYAGYDPETKKQFTKSFTGKDLRDLKYKAALWEAEHKAYHDPDTLGVVIERYVKTAALSPSTARSYLSIWRNLPDWLVRTPAHAFSDALCERFVRESTNSPKTIKNSVALITASLKAAGHPTPSVRLPQVPVPEMNIPDAETVKKTLEAADGELWICIMLAATGPLRLGEICALSIDDIDGSRIHVRHNMVYGADHAYHIKAPKTRTSDRYIDMSPDLIEKIREQGYVTNYTPKGLQKRFRTLLRRAGIPHYRFHDLRHFCISELLSQGLGEAYVQERSGHTSHATMQRYIHVLGNRRKEASERILAHFGSLFT